MVARTKGLRKGKHIKLDKQGFVMACLSVRVCQCVFVCVCGVCLLTSIPFFVGAALQQATTRQQVEETTNWFRQIPSPCGKGAARLSGYARDGNWAETGTGTGTGNWWLLTGDRRLWVAYKAEPVWSSGLPMSWRKSNFNVLLPKSIKSWIIAQDVCTCVEDMRNRVPVPVPESRSRPPRCLAPCHCTEPPSPAPGCCWWWLPICLLCRALGLPGFVHLTLFLSLFLSPPPPLSLFGYSWDLLQGTSLVTILYTPSVWGADCTSMASWS